MSKPAREEDRSNQMLDPLTGVYSRLSLDARLEEEIARARRYAQPFSLLMLDMDHFKSVNDGFGHARGDEALIEFARRMQRTVRGSDLIFRLGGDEFILLLPNTGRDEASALAGRLLLAVRETAFGGDPSINLTVSIGVASFAVDGRSSDELMRSAERRSYHAKRLGRDRVVEVEVQPEGELSFDVLSRLIERDAAQEKLQRFLDSLSYEARRVLRVTGAPGCGQSRFLAEVENLARLRGYAVLALRGDHALQMRIFGALCEAKGLDGLPHPSVGVSDYAVALSEKVAREGWTGLQVIVDDLMYIDRASLEFLHDLYFCSDLPQLALAFADQSAGARLDFLHEVPHPLRIELQPFSSHGVRLWLRHSLQWEAPQEFVDWLHVETGGRPADLKRATTLLVERELLRRQETGWALAPAFALDAGLQALLLPGFPKTNLPASLGDFVGREAELRRIKRLLDEQRLVSILAPGGLGKTRLALQVALERQAEFRDGVFFVPLASLVAVRPSADHLLDAIADALGVTLKSSGDGREELLAYLKPKELMLVLDGFENLLDATPLLSEIYEQAIGVRLLVTSRNRLDPPFGAVLDLDALPYPEGEAVRAIESALKRYTAVQLFLHLTSRARYQGNGAEVDWPAVIQVCRLLRGIPLGLELAAAWAETLTFQEIAGQIEASLKFLLEEQAAFEGQPNLYAVFESFWRSLSTYEQGALRQLSVFRGGFSQEAARQVAGASPFFLYALASASYLRRVYQERLPDHATPRYETHLLLQQYALERLSRLPEEEKQACLRHCDYYIAFLAQRATRLRGERLAQEEVRAELDNVRAAWRYAADHCLLDRMELVVEALIDFCAFTGLLVEGVGMLELAVACARHQCAINATLDICRILGKLLVQQGRLCMMRGDYPKALELAAEAQALARQFGLTALEAYAGMVQGVGCLGQSRHADARQHLQHGLAQAQAAGDRQVEADILRNLGNVEIDLSQEESARQYYLRALEICREVGDRRSEGGTLNNLGLLAMYREDFDEAGRAFESFFDLSRQVGDVIGEATALLNWAIIDAYTFHFAAGRKHVERAIALTEAIGARYDAMQAIWTLAFLELSQGDLEAAARRYADALRRAEEIGDRVCCANIQNDMALLHNRLGDNERACAFASQAYQAGHELQLHDVIGHAQNQMGFACLSLGELDAAEEACREAESLWRADDHLNFAMESIACLALVALRGDDLPPALSRVEEILAYLESRSLAGTVEPAHVYLACAQVLATASDPRLPQLLHQARTWLFEKADLQENPALRRMFLEDIPLHKQLLQVIEQHQSPA